MMIITDIICATGRLFFSLKSKAIPENPKKILIIRSGAIGDILMSTPFISELRNKYSEAKMYYMVGRWSFHALKNNPDVDRLLVFEDKIIYEKNFAEVFKLIRKIRKENFDLCFVLDKSWLWGLFAWLCNIRFRVGFNRKGEGFANNITVPFEGVKYELEYYLDLAKKIGIKVSDKKIRICCNKQDTNRARKFLTTNKLNNKILIGIAPGGASNPGQDFLEKRWPIEKYAELIDRLLRNNKNRYVLLFGGISDKNLLENLKSEIKSKKIFIAPLNSIQVSYLLMNRCKVIITHDSGAMHIAGASNSEVIVIFGPTQSERFAPKNSKVLEFKSKTCPCYNIYGKHDEKCKEDCMKHIGVKSVFDSINIILKK